MPKKYEPEFKKNAVELLNLLRSEGSIRNDEKGYKIQNVKELCQYLGVSTYTLYEWEKVTRKEPQEDLPMNEDFIPDKDLKLGGSFWMFLARSLEIPNYRSYRVKTLKKLIGKVLLEGA